MKKLLTIIALATGVAQAAKAPFIPEVDARFIALENATTDYSTSGDGSFPMKVSVVDINYAQIDTVGETIVYALDIPANAVIPNCFYEVTQTFTSEASDAATIALGIAASADVVASTAISAGGNVWDEGLHQGVPDWGTASDWIKMPASAKDLAVDRGVATLTAGDMIVYCQYFDGE